MTKAVGMVLILLVLGLVPFGLIALSRSRTSPDPAIHPIQDMAKQPKFKAQRGNPMFADERAMRPRVAGAEAREDLRVPNEALNDPEFPRMIGGAGGSDPIVLQDQAMYDRIMLGQEKQTGGGGQRGWVTQIPVPVSKDLLQRGQERFTIYCMPCHGLSGYGDGMVARRAAELQALGTDAASGWVPPTSYHTDDLRNRPVGHLYNTVLNGIRSMPAYGKQIGVLDRWAIVAYVKALQRSQHATPDDVPETERGKFTPGSTAP